MADLCTYCERELDGSAEHIVQSAIGGRLWSENILCSKTNNDFGSTFDRAFTESLAVISNGLNITTGRNEAPARLRDLTTADGRRIDLLPGAIPFQGRPVILKEESDGQIHITVQVDASNAEVAPRLLDQLARQYRPEGGAGLNITTTLGRRFERQPVQCDFIINHPEHRRAAAKIALNLLAHQGGSGLARDPAFARLRDFIVHGKSDDELVWLDYCLRQPSLPGFEPPPLGSHVVIVSANGVDHLVVGIVEIFQLLRFSVVMSKSWQGGNFVLRHIVDPVSGRSSLSSGSESDVLGMSDLEKRGVSNEAFDTRAKALSRYMEDRQKDAALSALIHESVVSVLVPEPGQEVMTITQDHIDRMTNMIASRFTDFTFRTDRVVPLGPNPAPAVFAGSKTRRRSRRRRGSGLR